MAGLVGEAVDLVLDGRAVARPHPFDHPGKHGRTFETRADDVVGARVGMGDPARQLARMHGATAEEGKYGSRIIARLFLAFRPVDAAAVETRRRAGFQAAYRQVELAQAMRERFRRRVARAPRLVILQADMDQAGEEGAGGEHHRVSGKLQAQPGSHARDAVAFHQEIVHRLLEQGEVFRVFQATTDRSLVQHAIGLGAGSAHRRALGGI